MGLGTDYTASSYYGHVPNLYCKGTWQTDKSVCSNTLCMYTVAMAFTGQSRNLHIMAGTFFLDTLYLTRKTPLLVEEYRAYGDYITSFYMCSSRNIQHVCSASSYEHSHSLDSRLPITGFKLLTNFKPYHHYNYSPVRAYRLLPNLS